jgi:hypothetical protein
MSWRFSWIFLFRNRFLLYTIADKKKTNRSALRLFGGIRLECLIVESVSGAHDLRTSWSRQRPHSAADHLPFFGLGSMTVAALALVTNRGTRHIPFLRYGQNFRVQPNIALGRSGIAVTLRHRAGNKIHRAVSSLVGQTRRLTGKSVLKGHRWFPQLV